LFRRVTDGVHRARERAGARVEPVRGVALGTSRQWTTSFPGSSHPTLLDMKVSPAAGNQGDVGGRGTTWRAGGTRPALRTACGSTGDGFKKVAAVLAARAAGESRRQTRAGFRFSRGEYAGLLRTVLKQKKIGSGFSVTSFASIAAKGSRARPSWDLAPAHPTAPAVSVGRRAGRDSSSTAPPALGTMTFRALCCDAPDTLDQGGGALLGRLI